MCVCGSVCVCCLAETSVCLQYAADAKDKQWLAERHHMRATGGKMVRRQLSHRTLNVSLKKQKTAKREPKHFLCSGIPADRGGHPRFISQR